MSLKKRFSDAELQRIKDAVKVAEEKISGEIVPVIVEKSGYYTSANYKGSLIGASLAFLAMILIDRYTLHDSSITLYYDPIFMLLAVIVGGLVGALIPQFVPDIMRLLISKRDLNVATHRKAESAFLQEEVFNTRQRTGIMIFISFFEREVIVMADKGISKVVDQKMWDSIVAELINQIRLGQVVGGLEGAIKRCGDLLLEKGFTIAADDINELKDDLRVE